MKIPIVSFVVLALASTPAFAADAAEGQWRTARGDVYALAPCAETTTLMCGKLTTVASGASALDALNPNPELRDRALVGLDAISGLKQRAAGRWAEGTFYNAVTGKTYEVRATAKGADTLRVKTCRGESCSDTDWTRTN